MKRENFDLTLITNYLKKFLVCIYWQHFLPSCNFARVRTKYTCCREIAKGVSVTRIGSSVRDQEARDLTRSTFGLVVRQAIRNSC